MARLAFILFLFLIVSVVFTVEPAENVGAGVVDPCNSVATAPSGVLFSCPAGDGDALAANGLTISVTIRDNVNAPIAGILAADIWVIGCNDLLALCGGSGAISASGPTDANGQTTITGRLAAGGCDTGLRAVWQGVAIGAGVCADPCLTIKVRSCDINGNLVTNLTDFAIFGTGYTSPPRSYNECIDYAAPFGTVTLPDFARYGSHSAHSC